jgi:hypothetical protein
MRPGPSEIKAKDMNGREVIAEFSKVMATRQKLENEFDPAP